MTTFHGSSKISRELQLELANYGIMRDESKQTAGTGNLFGLKETTGEYDIYAPDKLDATHGAYGDVDLAIVPNEIDPFDMLAPKDFAEKLKLSKPENLRAFLMRLIDTCEI